QADVAALAHGRELRSVLDGFLVQGRDEVVSSSREWEQVSGAALSASVRADLEFAWRICSQVKSNAIVIVKDQMVIAVGAGQMSRIDSVEVALAKARLHQHDLHGAVAASDAFFPFPDGVETLGKSGVSAIVAPRGAKRDEEVRAVAAAHAVALCFAPERHFRH
ncbi:MAG: bifunctional phosphoribosylaminoimidazolecarboxamide formyltransferase/IMP cyclohydrolase, partial [Oligoflexia bacterium]|nr:bifunctional phosphoribosylaminoimidazolecarboxamide formyltransferase/IMP cyclohydrolase [Oligoflexia bacterium]